MLSPYQFASNTPIRAIDLDGKLTVLFTGNVTAFAFVTGLDLGAGFAIGPEGIALYYGGALKFGAGIEGSAGIQGALFPTMTDLNDLGGSSTGGSFAGAFLGKFGVGTVKSTGKWGGTVSYGGGMGLHLSFDVGYSGIKIIKWEEIAEKVTQSINSGNEEDGKAIAAAFGITKDNVNNTVQIIKSFYKAQSTGLINARVNDLQSENTKESDRVKAADSFINQYNKSGKVSKLFNYFLKKQAEVAKDIAKENIKKNNEEIKTLQNEKQKLQEQ